MPVPGRVEGHCRRVLRGRRGEEGGAVSIEPTLYEGDCRAILPSLRDGRVECCITSPPYWSSRGERSGAIGREPTPEAYIENLASVFRQVHPVVSLQGCAWLILGDDPAAPGLSRRVADQLARDGWFLAREFLWVEEQPSEQNVFLFAKSAERASQLALSPFDRVWRFEADTAPDDYPWSVLPVKLAERCILPVSSKRGAVLDPFCGLGSVGVAAIRLGREFIGIEKDRRVLQLAWERMRAAGA